MNCKTCGNPMILGVMNTVPTPSEVYDCINPYCPAHVISVDKYETISRVVLLSTNPYGVYPIEHWGYQSSTWGRAYSIAMFVDNGWGLNTFIKSGMTLDAANEVKKSLLGLNKDSGKIVQINQLVLDCKKAKELGETDTSDKLATDNRELMELIYKHESENDELSARNRLFFWYKKGKEGRNEIK